MIGLSSSLDVQAKVLMLETRKGEGAMHRASRSSAAGRPRAILGLLGLLGGAACVDQPNAAVAPEITPTLMASIVTGAAKSNLDASGHFRLKGPPDAGPRQLQKEEAEALAAIWPQQFGTWTRSVFEQLYGRSNSVRGPDQSLNVSMAGQSTLLRSSCVAALYTRSLR
jgi:hypothetical protein